VSELQLPRHKNKNFLGKNKLGCYAANNKRRTLGASCHASCVQGFKELLGRGAAPTPRPAWRYLFKKLPQFLGGESQIN